jgi:DNA-binding transcriptional ArsR family regulator
MVDATIFRALADPTRRQVFERLCKAEMSVSELTARFHVSQPAISQHLSVLKSAGLVAERRAGRNVHYRSNPEGLGALAEWVDHYRVFWPAKLEKLKRVLKEMDRE